MTFVTHGVVGAGLFALIFGFSLESAIVGFILGGVPDTLDWILAVLFPSKIQRYGPVYGWFHHSWCGLLMSVILIAPLPHLLHDKFIHMPVLPRVGESVELDTVVWSWPLGITLTRHDAIWLGGELQQLYLGGLLFALSFLIR